MWSGMFDGCGAGGLMAGMGDCYTATGREPEKSGGFWNGGSWTASFFAARRPLNGDGVHIGVDKVIGKGGWSGKGIGNRLPPLRHAQVARSLTRRRAAPIARRHFFW